MKPPQQNLSERVLEAFEKISHSSSLSTGQVWSYNAEIKSFLRSTLQNIEKQVLELIPFTRGGVLETGETQDFRDGQNSIIEDIRTELSKLFRGEK